MRPLGVGLVWWPALAPLFDGGEAQVLELEPQTLWSRGSAGYELNAALFDAVARLPQPKLLHGVGQPVGGTVDDPLPHAPLLRRTAQRLQPAWASEHLSFNRVLRDGHVRECGFLLPPPQTPASARVAAANLRRYAQATGGPVAFETGVNYFRPQPGDMDDGRYFAAVAEGADCGILLDLHNLWCNERNGRARVDDVMAQLPLERVWEVHLAGGMPLDGFWLDAHSDRIAPALMEIAAQWIPRLPNLGALMFEILPEHLPRIGLDGVQRELETLRALWRKRPARTVHVAPPRGGIATAAPEDIAETRAREIALADALAGDPGAPLADDPACALLRRLIREFRSANLTRGLRFTLTLLLASLGAASTEALMRAYFDTAPAEGFAAMESHGFARFLAGHARLAEAVPYLGQVLAFETALLEAALFGTRSDLVWRVDPTQLLEALEAGDLPPALPAMESRMTVTG